MYEMLGENNEWGIVTENTDEALYEGIKKLVSNPELLSHYKEKAKERGKVFSTEETVKATEEFLLNL
jgi:glycosyltransferase involved in cell wall biosynthesis